VFFDCFRVSQIGYFLCDFAGCGEIGRLRRPVLKKSGKFGLSSVGIPPVARSGVGPKPPPPPRAMGRFLLKQSPTHIRVPHLSLDKQQPESVRAKARERKDNDATAQPTVTCKKEMKLDP